MNIIDKATWGAITIEEWNGITTRRREDLNHCNNLAEEAIIRSDLAVAAFFQERVSETLSQAKRCHEISEKFKEPERYLNVLFVEATAYLAQTEEQPDQSEQLLQSALKTATLAVELFALKGLTDLYLKGDTYSLLGLVQAQDPKGNLEEALGNYKIALDSFMTVNATLRCMATQVQIGKISRKLNKPVEFIFITFEKQGPTEVSKVPDEELDSIISRHPPLQREERIRASSRSCNIL